MLIVRKELSIKQSMKRLDKELRYALKLKLKDGLVYLLDKMKHFPPHKLYVICELRVFLKTENTEIVFTHSFGFLNLIMVRLEKAMLTFLGVF